MVVKKFYPALEQKIPYMFYSHPQPWSLSCGEIGEAVLEDDTIYVPFSLKRSEAIKNDRWDPIKECVILEVIDSENRVVFETSVPMDKKFIQGRIGLK